MVIVLTSHLADAHENILSEQDAYEAALRLADYHGLVGDPTNYAIQRMSLAEWGNLTDTEFNPAEVDIAQSLWVVVLTGNMQLKNTPMASWLGEGDPPADWNSLDYYLIAIDAATGDKMGSSVDHSVDNRPLAADKAAPARGTYPEP